MRLRVCFALPFHGVWVGLAWERSAWDLLIKERNIMESFTISQKRSIEYATLIMG